ncbi:ribosome biogenesis protein [Candidatus Woesearchaeota archaeon CG1_02_47_18]|nr:MAG: ribosome biogenesis protein [Candidatus Woesearchaeota archaeon CG1_02_47_18]
MKHILKCSLCGSYTTAEACPKCGGKALSPRPARFSPEDKYGDYRRRAKELQSCKEVCK